MRKIYSFLLLGLLFLSIGNVWATEQYYELTFNTTGTSSDSGNSWTTNSSVSNVLTAGSAYVSSISAVANVYPGRDGRGAKFGTSSKAGSITFALSDAGQVKATKVVITGGAYISSNAAEPASVKVNDGTAVAFDQTVITFTEEEITYNFPTPTDITTLKLSQVVANKGRLYIISVKVYYDDEGGIPDPSISAENVELEYDATNGNIDVVVNNPVTGGVLTAESSEDWLTIGSITSITSVPLTFAANSQATARTSVVTLTYTYNTNETVTKNVTVTQSANPNAVIDINAIDAGSITCNVKGTIVAMCARGLVVGDGTGYVYYYGGSSFSTTKTINDVVKISGTTSTYGNVIQFPGTATIEDADNSSYDNTPAVQALDAAGIGAYGSGLHLSDYVQLEGTLVKSNNYYNLQVENLATDASIAYPTTAQASEMENLLDSYVIVKGYFAGNSSGHFNVVLESIEEAVAPVIPSVVVEETAINAPYTGILDGVVNVTYNNITEIEASVAFFEADGETLAAEPDWIITDIDIQTHNLVYVVDVNEGAARTAYMRVLATINESTVIYSELITISQAAVPALLINYSIVHNEAEIIPGAHYLIASGTDGEIKIMNEQKSTNRGALTVTADNGVIGIEEGTDFHEFVICKDGDKYAIYEAGVGYLYAAASGSNSLKSQATNNVNGQWTITIDDAIASIVATESTNRNVMRYNTSGSGLFNCYASATQSPVYLYMKDDETFTTEAVAISEVGYATLYYGEENLIVPEGVEAHTYTMNEGVLEEVKTYAEGEVIPKGQAVVLEGGAGNHEFIVTPVVGVGPSVANVLKGSDEAALTTGGTYFYGLSLNSENVLSSVGFYWMADGGAAFTNGAHKAYLALDELPAGAPERILLNNNNATNIMNVDDVENAVKFMENGKLFIKKNGVIYNAVGAIVK